MAITSFSNVKASTYLIGALVALMAAACTAQPAGSTAVVAGENLTQPRHLLAGNEETGTSSDLVSLVDVQEAAPALSPASMTVCKLDDPKVYLVTDNQRRHIVDWATFTNLGFKPEQIVPCNAMAAYAEGAPITRLLKGSGEPVYWMEAGFRRHIPDMQTFSSLGLQVKDISVVPDALLNSWPLGKPMPKAPGRLTAQTECPNVTPANRGGGDPDGPLTISPNRQCISFSSNPSGAARLYIVKTDGSARLRIDAPNKAFPLTSPIWSPNSQYIAFASMYLSQPGGGRIYVARADGSGLVSVAEYAGYYDSLAWSPDGKQIAFTSGKVIGQGSGTEVVDYKIFTVSVTGSGQPQMALSGCNPMWKP